MAPRKSGFHSVARQLASAVSGLQQRGRLLVALPRGRILRGFYLDGSIDKERCYLQAFVQPLYVPATNFVFNLGLRLGGPSRSWLHTDTDAMVAALRDEGLPFIAPPQSPEDFTRWPAAHDQPDEYSREALSYSLVAAGRFAEALDGLDRLATVRGDAIDWQRVIAQRASRLATLCRGETDAAQALLRGWESQTAAALGIEDIA